MVEKNKLTLDEVMEAADILRAILDREQRKNELLQQCNKELELLLLQNDITIPDYELWHGILPMV